MVGKFSLSLLVLLFFQFSIAQNVQVVSQLSSKYSQERAIYLNYEQEIVYDMVAEKPTIKVNVVDEKLLLKEEAINLASERIYFNSFMKVDDLEAGTYVLDKNKYKFLKVADKKVQKPQSNSIFYDDAEEIVFNYPNPAKDHILSCKYSTNGNVPWLSQTLLFQHDYVIANLVYRIKVAQGIEAGINHFGKMPDCISYSEWMDGKGYKVYEWKGTDVPKFEFEDSAPPVLSWVPHIAVYIKGYKDKAGQWTPVTGDLDALYNQYFQLTKDVLVEPDDSLKAMTKKIVGNRISANEKARSIYNWVQDNIKYIAFEHGMEGFIPRNSTQVCNKKYGDCKDMAILIVNMCRIAGLKAWPVWIGSRDIPYRYDELATSAADNHMIACVEIDGQKRMLDATGEYQPFQLFTSFIQGKEGLVGIDAKNYEVIKLPVIEANKNAMVDSVSLTIDLEKNRINGNGRLTAAAYRKIDLQYKINGKNDEETKQFNRAFLSKGNNKFILGNVEWKGLQERENNLIANYDFYIENYTRKIGDELYINLILEKPFINQSIDTLKRKLPISYDNTLMNTNIVVFEIPNGYELKQLPESVHNDFDNLFGYDVKYERLGNKVVCRNSIYIDTLVLDIPHFKLWNKMLQELRKIYNQSLTLVKK